MKAATELTCAPKGAVAISIHAAREGGDQQQPWRYKTVDISIHAAREGGDPLQRLLALKHIDFNPRRP